MTYSRYPISMLNTLIDLRMRLLGLQVNELGGVPKRRIIRGRAYWYAEVAIKGHKVQHYVGPDDETTREKIEQAQKAVDDARIARKARRSMVKQLANAGAPQPDPGTGAILRAMSAAGVFRLGGVLVGTHAYRLYSLELGYYMGGTHLTTMDLDIAAFRHLSVALEETANPSLKTALSRLGMQPTPSLDDRRPTRWQTSGMELAVEFLTPSFSDEQKPLRLETLDIWAQGLHFLNFLITEPIQAVALYLDGILVQIPSPERYAVHKLIVAQRCQQTREDKSRKDLDQAKDLIEILATDRSQDLEDAYVDALETGPAWRKAMQQSLSDRADIRALMPKI